MYNYNISSDGVVLYTPQGKVVINKDDDVDFNELVIAIFNNDWDYVNKHIQNLPILEEIVSYVDDENQIKNSNLNDFQQDMLKINEDEILCFKELTEEQKLQSIISTMHTVERLLKVESDLYKLDTNLILLLREVSNILGESIENIVSILVNNKHDEE